MGLLSGLVTLPLAPVRAVGWTLSQLVAEAEREQRDAARRQLAALDEALRAGEISEAEFDRREDELLDLLDALDGWEPGG